MTEVISVRFKNKGKVYYFDPAGLTISSGDAVIVETSKGLEFAECTWGNHEVEDHCIIPPLRPVVRIATEEDKKRAEENKMREAEAFVICQKKIAEHGLDMKLVDVEFSFEGNKILFFFTSDGRVDFRELVRDLASVFKTRIELRQIGVRDEARMIGGLGICGKPFCCTQFLDEFHPVSIKMAKTQGLSLNPVKISGTCGRLMCCLKYEEEAYEEIVKKAPKVDAFVETPYGKGSVISVNLLRGYAKVRLEDGIDTTLKTFNFDELEVLGGKARRAEYLAAKAEGRLEEAGFTVTPKPPPPPPEPVLPPVELAKPEEKEDDPPVEKEKAAKPAPKKRKKGAKRAKAAPKAEKKVEKKAIAVKPAAPEGAGKPKKAKRTHRGGRGGKSKPRGGAEAPQ
ncbi:MAG: stage 0 sporulation family protein [Clostridiales bacterium]|nr:stage 0 sporulation family protein [Clostridiales bacterium]